MWLLGEMALRLGDDRLEPVESARVRSLLGYLLLHVEVPHARQHLAFLLWPDSTEAQARTNLRKAIHMLRRDCPEVAPFLAVTARTIQWRGDRPWWLDVAAFESAIAEAADAPVGSDEEVAALGCAVGLYAGDLLAGCYDEWLIAERERLRDRYLSALHRLTSLASERDQHAEAIRVGRELLRADPLQEDSYRLLMRAYHAAGDRAAAVRVYHECVATLQRELGVDPSKETEETYAALIRSEQPRPGNRRAGPVTPATLVGRRDAWDQLVQPWNEAAAGRSQLVLVTGEAGIGKTRLVEELGAWCVHRGAVVAQGRSYPTEGELGYGVVISWLRTPAFAPQLRRASPSDLTALARLLPDLDASPTALTEVLDETEQRRRLFDAAVRTMTTSGRPTVLVADDAQWCDAQSLQLIHYLVRAEPTSPVLVVATVRREELDEGHPLTALVSGLQVLDRTTEIALDRLTRSDTQELALQVSGRELGAAAIDELYVETEGIPSSSSRRFAPGRIEVRITRRR